MKADAGGIGQSVSQRRGHRVDRRFAHALGAQGAKGIRCPGKIDLTAWDVGISRDTVVAECRVDDSSILVEHHFFVKGPSQSLGNSTFDLAPELLRIDHDPSVGRLNALEDLDFPGNAMDSDPETVHVEGYRARRSMGLAHDPQKLPRLPCSVVKINQPDPGAIANHSVGFQPAFVAIGTAMPGSEIQDAIPERFGRLMHRLSGHGRPSAGRTARYHSRCDRCQTGLRSRTLSGSAEHRGHDLVADRG